MHSGLGIALGVVGCVLILTCSLVAIPVLTAARRPRGGAEVRIPGQRAGSAQSPHPRAGLDVGDRVTAAEGLGGFLRPRRYTRIITARRPEGLLQVRFVTGKTISVAPGQLVHASADPGSE